MTLLTWISDPALQALVSSVLVLFAADFITGSLAAIRSGIFSQTEAGSILVKQGSSILSVIVLAGLSGGLDTPLGILAVGASGAYALTAQKSIRENLGELVSPPAPDNGVG